VNGNGHALRRLLIVNMVLSFVLALSAIGAVLWARDVADSVAQILERRNVTIDALHVDAERQECVDRTEVAWMLGFTQALLMTPDSPEQAAAVQRLAPIAEELRTVEQRCYDENPLPTQPAPDQPAPIVSTSSATEDGEDGMDGLDGRAGRDGRDGKDGADGEDGAPGAGTDGAPGTPGQDGAPGPQGPAGADGAAGKDGADGAEGPQGPQGEQGFPGFDGAPPVGWWYEGQFCSDPDADLIYECAAP
jgi:hypothetical protein